MRSTKLAKKTLKDLMRLPKQRPNPLSALLAVLSGAAMSWGVEVFDDDRVKEQAIQEATNTGLLTALLLTISAGPLLGDPPAFLEGERWRIDFWFTGWFLSTIFLGLATVVAVMQNIVFTSLSGEDIRMFHEEAGVMMHAPLLLFVSGTILLLGTVASGLYYAVSRTVWVVALVVGILLLLLLLAIVVKMSLLSYDAYAAQRKRQEEDSSRSDIGNHQSLAAGE